MAISSFSQKVTRWLPLFLLLPPTFCLLPSICLARAKFSKPSFRFICPRYFSCLFLILSMCSFRCHFLKEFLGVYSFPLWNFQYPSVEKTFRLAPVFALSLGTLFSIHWRVRGWISPSKDERFSLFLIKFSLYLFAQ